MTSHLLGRDNGRREREKVEFNQSTENVHHCGPIAENYCGFPPYRFPVWHYVEWIPVAEAPHDRHQRKRPHWSDPPDSADPALTLTIQLKSVGSFRGRLGSPAEGSCWWGIRSIRRNQKRPGSSRVAAGTAVLPFGRKRRRWMIIRWGLVLGCDPSRGKRKLADAVPSSGYVSLSLLPVGHSLICVSVPIRFWWQQRLTQPLLQLNSTKRNRLELKSIQMS